VLLEQHGGPSTQSPVRSASVFSNHPASPAGESAAPAVSVILFDSLNTKFADQSAVHSALAKFIAGVPMDRPVAV
jgi:hypothetical protein